VVVLRASSEGKSYAIAVGIGMSDLIASLDEVRWLLLLVWAVSTATTAAAGFALASTALAPVAAMTRRAIEIARTDIRGRLEPSPVQDEIGQMTQALNTLIERLHEALDANRRFAADAAHELRSPVTAIAGEIEVALRRERTADEYRHTLTLVQRRLTTLSTLIADLLVLVRAQESGTTPRRREIALDALVRGAAERFAELAASRRITLTVTGLDALVTYADPGLLARVFDNVLENAIRYNRDDGAVSVQGEFVDAADDAWTPGLVTIRVSDTGIGIPAADSERIFDRFHRVDRSRARFTGGSGLGLAIAREVLALFNGSIAVEQSSQQGTVMVIRIPGGRHALAAAADK
jgi:signal transduction histidine kinase